MAGSAGYTGRVESDVGDAGIARAGAAVAARRRELDIKQRNLAKYKIINAGALIAFEKGRSWPRERTRAKLEEVLQWPDGTIASIRYGGAIPGAALEPSANDGAASLIAGTVEVAMTTIGAAIESLPADDDAGFAARAAVILADLRKLEAVVARAAQRSRGTADVVLALRTVRGSYDDLMFRAAAAPGATLGQRLYLARRRANLSAAETANAAGVPVELVDAVEAGEPAGDADTAKLDELVMSLDG
jgi:transcriptional regulator with XRE-family HTH domain